MRTIRHLLSLIAGVCLILAVIFGPLAFGSVEPWAYTILALLAFTAFACSLVHGIQVGHVRYSLPPAIWIGVAGVALLILQLIPWPAELLERVNPGVVSFHSEMAATLGEPVETHIVPSLYPHATKSSLIKLAAYIALFGAACGYMSTRKRLNRVAVAIVATGFVISLVGILQSLSGAGEIFWLRPIEGGSIFGSFVSRNQFATYAGICLFTGIGLLLARGGGSRALFGGRNGRGLPKAKPSQHLLLGFAVSIMAAAVLWSLSRGGVISAILSSAAVVAALIAARYSSRKRIYALAVLLFALGLITWLGWEPVMDRLATLGVMVEDPMSIDNSRYVMWGDAWEMGLTFPAMGTGAGTFYSVYPLFRSLPTDAVTRSPHNEYLGVLSETGFAGLALMMIAVVWILAKVFKALRVRQDAYTLEFLAGGVGAIFMVVFHSVVDFPLRSPGIVVTLVVVAALLYRLAVLDRKKSGSRAATAGAGGNGDPRSIASEAAGRREESVARTSGGSAAVNGLLTVAVFIGWLFACHTALAELHGQIEEARIKRASEKLTPQTGNVIEFIAASEDSIQRYSSTNASLYAVLSEFAVEAAEIMESPAKRLALMDKALELMETAAGLEPVNVEHRFNLAMGYLAFNRPDLAWIHSRAAAKLVPNDPWIRTEIARGFFEAGLAEPALEMLDAAESLARSRDMEPALRTIQRVRSRFLSEGNAP